VPGYLLLTICVCALAAYLVGVRTAHRFAMAGERLQSVPSYHGAYVAIRVGVPALVLVLLWMALQDSVVDRLLLHSLDIESARSDLLLAEIHNVASGIILRQPTPEVADAAARLARWSALAHAALFVVILAAMLIGLFLARARLAPRFRARSSVERTMSAFMIGCSLVAILTTAGIVVSLVYEAWTFFTMVPPADFLFGLQWEPQIAIRPDQVVGAGAFGAVPLFLGTFVIATIAMLVAVPIGLFSAIYLVEYASPRTRSVLKPSLEVLAGVPTVVYGFFAVLTVAPAVRQAGTLLGIAISPNAALVAGLVMGVMIVPLVSSLSDDALRAVPRSLRDGSLAMGATPAETMIRVLVPAALPGIAGGVLLGLSRAIGETMIVVMAAGLVATLTVNPLNSVTTVTAQIVTLLVGDTEFTSPKTLAAFALGLVLFVVTLALNMAALAIVRRYRERYE
jgi:phosphate transport system permease protein